ncbi:unnamed protein product [Thelazia callipaeda]|uniref:Rab3 GTPase-activating protein catalytic subunit n=1 Tax=Thelazia callipaeda TaxID=103827 RepID=A0A0N5CWU2_THECL|nr:unnamed protein product [Thelazia callipaeda]
MKCRKIQSSELERSSSSSTSHKLSQTSDDKSQQLLDGSLSPLHTRRRSLNGSVTPVPDFAQFDYLRECPKLITVANESSYQSITAAFSDLDKVQLELERMLMHTTDHQKKICGEITFLTTGDYPSDDISHRPMPIYDLRSLDILPSCSSEIDREWLEDEILEDEVNWLDDGFDVWPPVNLSQKFWVFVREYLDPVDEEYLQQWWTNIVQLFGCSKDLISSKSSAGNLCLGIFISIIRKSRRSTKTVNICDVFQDCKASSSCSKWEAHVSSQDKSPVSSSSFELTLPNKDVSPPPKKIPRCESRTQSFSSTEATSLISALMKAYIREKDDSSERKNCEWIVNDEEDGIENTLEISHSNGHENILANFGDELEMFNYVLCNYLNSLDKDSDASQCGEEKESIKSEGFEELVRSPSNKKIDNKDEVSVALMKLQAELAIKEVSWREIVYKIWHRLIAEYLRTKLERELDKADREASYFIYFMFQVYDKYFSDYPKRRPKNEQEREECRSVLQRRNQIAQAYYGKQHVALSKWRQKH